MPDDRSEALGILITGIYGVGKSTLVETIAGELEERRTRYAALDLDWLGWFDPGVPGHDAAWPVTLQTWTRSSATTTRSVSAGS